jgi:hypothetical protein
VEPESRVAARALADPLAAVFAARLVVEERHGSDPQARFPQLDGYPVPARTAQSGLRFRNQGPPSLSVSPGSPRAMVPVFVF